MNDPRWRVSCEFVDRTTAERFMEALTWWLRQRVTLDRQPGRHRRVLRHSLYEDASPSLEPIGDN